MYYIQKRIAPDARVTESAMLTDILSGDEREVDVLVEGTMGGYPLTIAIEVRSHKRRQGVEWIEQIRGKYEHLPVNQVVPGVSIRFHPVSAGEGAPTGSRRRWFGWFAVAVSWVQGEFFALVEDAQVGVLDDDGDGLPVWARPTRSR